MIGRQLGVEVHLLAEVAEVLDVVGAEGAEAHREVSLVPSCCAAWSTWTASFSPSGRITRVRAGVLGGEDELLEVGGAGGDLREADDLGAVGLEPSST